MGAGSVIAAMAGTQDIDRMGGFRRAMPFTSAMLVVGSLALAGFPPTSGWLSKDEILVFAADRGGMYWIFAVAGYLAAFLTALYAFRLVFRVCFGEPCEEARELEDGHLAHEEPSNPLTGEPEDTDVGFPGPEHHIAERARPMALAMGALGLLAVIGGAIQIPEVTSTLETFLEPSFAGSAFASIAPSGGDAWLGLLVGAITSVSGIGLAYLLWVARPELPGRIRARASRLHAFLVNRWYFDQAYDALVYRPLIATGRFAGAVVETVLVQGIVTGTVGAVRGVGVIVRGAQSGFIRAYALLLVGGFAALGLYFLIVSS
jgi:NADH-quinone oxidoreductase subunit L